MAQQGLIVTLGGRLRVVKGYRMVCLKVLGRGKGILTLFHLGTHSEEIYCSLLGAISLGSIHVKEPFKRLAPLYIVLFYGVRQKSHIFQDKYAERSAF